MTLLHSLTSLSSCVAKITIAPFEAHSFNKLITICLFSESREAVGSSA